MNENDATIPDGEPIDDTEPMHLCSLCCAHDDEEHAPWCGDDAGMLIDA